MEIILSTGVYFSVVLLKYMKNRISCESCDIKIISSYGRKYCNKCSPTKKGLQGRDYLRELIRIRNKHICQICKKKWKKGNRRFDVHHLNKKFEGWDSPKKNPNGNKTGIYKNDKDNFNKMITLCHKCHLNLPHVRKSMSESK